ncbi:MAG: hypothetical protein K1X92_09305 [Bacteroidia bacterium]|nr:hypothetical protein [Bacteroidia bacterium]
MTRIIIIVLLSMTTMSIYGQATKKGVSVEDADPNDPRVQEMIKRQQLIQIDERDCGEFHLGTILFLNKQKKDIVFELVDIKGKKVCDVAIGKGKSTYVNNIEIGEYFYKDPKSKKAKKKNVVNVVECKLKGVVLD